MKTCPRCGVENKPEKAACWNCWAPLAPPAGGARQPAPTRLRLSLTIPWTAVAVVALVLIAAAGAYFFLLASRPADVTLQYLDAVRNGNEIKRDRLATADTGGQLLLPPVLMIKTAPEVDRAGITTAGGQAEVPASLQLTVDPFVIGLERADISDALIKHLARGPARVSVVLVREGLNWRVDQSQTRQRIIDAALADMPPDLKNHLWVAGLRSPGGAPASPPAGPAAPAPPSGA